VYVVIKSEAKITNREAIIMANFKNNPENPFEVRVPNKIRKRIVMHEKRTSTSNAVEIMKRRYGIETKQPKNRGSMWSRFTNRVKKFLR